MVYQIYFEKRRDCLFDIEFHKSINEFSRSDNDRWYMEIDVVTSISGALEFIQKKINSTNIQEFYDDCNIIEELRGWLWENHNNKLGNLNEINIRYSNIQKDLKEIIYKFATKWGLNVKED